MKRYIDLKKYGKNQSLRKRYFEPASTQHPAKMDLPLCRWIIDKFCYKDESEIILDPMAGIGSTLIMGMLMRPNSLFIGVELEDKFVKMARANIKKVEKIAKKDMFMKIGKAVCVQGDARDLSKIMKKKVNKIVTSAPFVESFKGSGYKAAQKRIKEGKYKGQRPDVFLSPTNIAAQGFADGYSKNPKNIGNLPYGQTDKIVTSPPYSEIRMDGGGKDRAGMKPYTDEPADTWRTQRDQKNIGNLPHGKIDKIISSPPYEEAMGKKHHSPANTKLTREKKLPNTYTDRVDKIVSSPPFEQTISSKAGGPTSKKFNPGGCRKLRSYSSNEDNIGNLKGKTYLGEMLMVYKQCYKILKPAGLMILITKDFIRNFKRVHLGEDTIKLCQAAGFTLKEIYYRKIEHPSFWRINYQQKHPEVEKIDSEDILIFEKTPSPQAG